MRPRSGTVLECAEKLFRSCRCKSGLDKEPVLMKIRISHQSSTKSHR
jgi:hypothetical protein